MPHLLKTVLSGINIETVNGSNAIGISRSDFDQDIEF
jgi:hypothetical protein